MIIVDHANRRLMGRLIFLILVFVFGSGNAAASIILGGYQETFVFIGLDQSNSLTSSDLILDNQDDTLLRTPLISHVNRYAGYYRQAALLSEIKGANTEPIRGPPYLSD